MHAHEVLAGPSCPAGTGMGSSSSGGLDAAQCIPGCVPPPAAAASGPRGWWSLPTPAGGRCGQREGGVVPGRSAAVAVLTGTLTPPSESLPHVRSAPHPSTHPAHLVRRSAASRASSSSAASRTASPCAYCSSSDRPSARSSAARTCTGRASGQAEQQRGEGCCKTSGQTAQAVAGASSPCGSPVACQPHR